MPKPKSDVTLDFHGDRSVLFRLDTVEARAWVDQHVSQDACRFGGSLVVEHRYVQSVLEAMHKDGLTIEQEGF